MAQPANAPMANPQEIIVHADGTYTPTGGVVINPGGEVKFSVTYPAGKNICIIPFGTISFDSDARAGGGNTIKVGS